MLFAIKFTQSELNRIFLWLFNCSKLVKEKTLLSFWMNKCEQLNLIGSHHLYGCIEVRNKSKIKKFLMEFKVQV